MNHHVNMRRMSTVVMLLSGGLIVLATAIITVEVIIRKLFNLSIGGADELAGYCFAISCVLAWIHCVIERANISIDALHARLPLQARAILDIIGFALMFSVVAVLTYTAYFVVQASATSSARSLTPLATPLVIPQAMWFAGLALLVLAIGYLLARALAALVRLDWQGVAEIAGAPTTAEIVSDEIELAREREKNTRKG